MATIVTVYSQNDDIISQTAHEQIIVALTPLLENNHPTQEICSFFTKVPHCCLSLADAHLVAVHCKVSFVVTFLLLCVLQFLFLVMLLVCFYHCR